MHETCETVKVVADNKQGFVVVNKSDITEDHILFNADSVTKKAPVRRTRRKKVDK